MATSGPSLVNSHTGVLAVRSAPIHYLGLDLLRFVAALLVVLDHFGGFSWRTVSAQAQGADTAFPTLHAMTTIGSIGVEIFFLISGFVISASTFGETPRGFALRRAIRVLPALWICSVLEFIARYSSGEPSRQLVPAFLRSIVLSPKGPYIDGVIWTLVIEAIFYTCIFCCLFSRRPRIFRSLAYALAVVSGGFVVLMFCADVPLHGHAWAAHIVSVGDRFPFKVLLLRHGVFFSAGMLLYDLVNQPKAGAVRLPVLGLVLLSCSLEICVLRRGGSEITACLSLWWGALGGLLWSVTYGRRHVFTLKELAAPIKFAGRLSYPLYLCHYSFGAVLVAAFARVGAPTLLNFVLSLAIIVVISGLVERFPERHAQRWLRAKLLPGRKDWTPPLR